ncbi:DUF2268 domain-containing putative Zn-dependent protease [Gracilibacillus alcaliphilus]|uniref:DUF2268 domain-containing protein n=1 Tax=Gracilibacillus alcaliphilus TaxID=1401441 RepID=UPI0019589467|nr:DUF2268 domain-containing putative Zn-dependent protease [Gracilibacillus alcaliphilus]MBM7677071.1 uncharacterized protein YjaZ [Gracilibacillus alcaliphilus]
MRIHSTNKWLMEWMDQRKKDKQDDILLQQRIICERLVPYFTSGDAAAIQQHLLNHGMFAPHTETDQIVEWLKQPFHQKVQKALVKCQQMWSGPDTDVFILPSNEEAKEFKQWYNSNAGLSYPDKLLLFLQKEASNGEILALIIHEYSHICRLNHFSKKESEYTVLDAVILEGIAEWLVRKYLGETYGNKRLTVLSDNEFQRLWQKWISPTQELTRDHPQHNIIMYGRRGTPKNIGYVIGFHLIHRFMEEKTLSTGELIQIANQDILQQVGL